MTIIDLPQTHSVIEPRYDMSTAEQAEVFQEMHADIQDVVDPTKTNIVIVESDTKAANYVRAVEAEKLPTLPSIMKDYEALSRFIIVMQDEPPKADRPAHVFRVNQVLQDLASDSPLPVGLPTFDDALREGLVTEEQLLAFYNVPSLRELGKRYLDVESNISIDGVKSSFRKPYSAIGYRAIFELVREEQLRGVVACQNPEAIKSLALMGLISTPLVGDPEIKMLDEDKLTRGVATDENYYPLTVEGTGYSDATITVGAHNTLVFTDPEYAARQTRIAGMIASLPINVIQLSRTRS